MATIEADWNTAGGDWFVSSNWDETDPVTNAPLHYVPGGNNDVVFGNTTANGPYTVTYNGTDAVNSLRGAGAVTLSINGGSLTVTNGTGTASSIFAFDLAGGATLSVASGSLYVGNIGASSVYSGVISGAGTFELGAGTTALDTTTVTVAELNIDGRNPGATVNLGNNLTYGGTFLDSGEFDTVNLQGNSLTLSGATTLVSGSTVNGPGTIDVMGQGIVGNNETFAGGAVLEDAGSIIQNGDIILNGTSQAPSKLQIDSGATYTLETGATAAASGNIEGFAPSTVNDGTLTVEGAGTSTIEGTFASSGTLSVASGATLNLASGTATLSGPVTGAGTLGIAAGSTTVLDTTNVGVAEIHINGGNPGATVNLGNDLTYGGTFLADGQFDTVNLQGNTLTLSGTATLVNGRSPFNGPGTIDVTGTGMVGSGENFGDGVVLEDANSISQNGDINLAGTAQAPSTLQIDSGATYTIATAGNITGSAPLTVNNGTLTDTAAGTSTIDGTLTDNGTLSVASGATLNLASGTATLSGPVTGAGTLGIDGNETTTLATTNVGVAEIHVNGGVVGTTLDLGANLTYGGMFLADGEFDTVNIQSNTLTLSGTTTLVDGSTFNGPGTIDVTGTGTIGDGETFAGSLLLEDANSITQNGNIGLNGTAQAPSTLQIDSGATYTIATAGNITGSAPLTVNNGTLTDTAAGTSTIDGTLTDNGTLSVASGATLNLASGTATLSGPVTGAGTLGIAAGDTTTIDTTNVGVAEIRVNGGNPGTTMDLGTSLTYGGTFLADGEFDNINLGGHNLTLSGATTLGSAVEITSGSTLDLAGSTAGTGTISFASSGPTSTLEVDAPGEPANGGTFSVNLGNFGNDDALDLTGLTYAAGATATYANGVLSVTSGTTTEDFKLSDPGSTTFYAHQDAGTGTIINDTAPVCFVAGTLIRTARGDVAVERLAIGDLVVTVSGDARPIRWLGHRTMDCRQHRTPHGILPVRISSHAFGPDRPSRDLDLSPGHPVLVGADADGEGGNLVPIMCLVNGTTIARVAVDEVTYWHVELDTHDILLAEGLPAESYLDWGDRGFFAEGVDHRLANPDLVVPGLAGRCRPVALGGPVVEAERRRLDMVFATRLAAACAWPAAEPPTATF